MIVNLRIIELILYIDEQNKQQSKKTLLDYFYSFSILFIFAIINKRILNGVVFMKKKFVSSCIASTILFGTLLGVTYKAEAATVHVAGGVWSHGIGKHYVWSYYSHNKRNHGSTAVGKYSSFSGVARPGVQSKASAPKAWGGNKTFYSLH
jgi:lactococcin 972 family bacteriocin